MGQHVAESVEAWRAQVVGVPAVSDWVTVDEGMISGFAEVTRDWNFLHTDESAAREAGMDRTIAHGFLTLALLAPMRVDAGLTSFRGMTKALNYGLDRVRFLTPVYSGNRVRGHFTVGGIVEVRSGHYRETLGVSVEIEGQDRPALIATWLAMYMV